MFDFLHCYGGEIAKALLASGGFVSLLCAFVAWCLNGEDE